MPDYSIETDPLRLVVRDGERPPVAKIEQDGDEFLLVAVKPTPIPRAALVEFARAVLAGELLNRDKDSPCYWPDCVCHTNLLCLNQGRKLRQALGHTGADD